MLDSLQEILYSLSRNKLRTALTAFGVFWGIFMLVLLLGAGSGLKHGIEKSFSSDLRNSMWIEATKTSIPYKGLAHGRHIQFVESDIEALKQEVEGIDIVTAENPLGAVRQSSINVSYKNKSGTYAVFGTAKDYFKIKAFQDYRQGRKLNALDNDQTRKVAVIGTTVAAGLFGEKTPINEQITISGVNFKVVGVFYDSGWEGRMSERIYIPLSTFQKTFGRGEDVRILAATPAPGFSGQQIKDQILNVLKSRHNVSPEDRKAISLWDLAEQTKKVSETITAINFFIWFVGLGTLAAGVVGISNIMIITVKERTVEIGIRKALGAKPINIIITILLESLLVTAMAGYAGLVLAVSLIELINYAMQRFNLQTTYFVNPEVDFSVAVLSLIVLVTAGAAAGFIPAVKAAKVSPIEAMRAE